MIPELDGLWARTAPAPPATAPLDQDSEAEVAVIGAGFTGLSAALHMARAGARVTVLDADAIGQGGSGRNVGLVNAGLWLMPDELEARLGPDHGPRLLSALGEGPALVWDLVRAHGIDCDAVRNGTLHCAPDPAGLESLRARAAQWQRRGTALHLLDRDETTARIGSDAFTAALLDPRAGTIQPLAYARGLARAAIAAGAVVHTDTPVTALTQDSLPQGHNGPGWRLQTPHGTLRAARVLVATNTYSASAGAALRAHQSVLPYFNLATAPLPSELRQSLLQGGEGCWDTAKILTSFRMDAEGRLILGSVGALGAADGAVHRGWARRRLRQLFPALADVAFETEWHGRIGNTPDALPRFHRHGPGMWSISGYNGRGIAPGTVFGQMLGRLALGETGPEAIPLPLQDAPSPDPLRHLREPFWRAGAAIWHLGSARG